MKTMFKQNFFSPTDEKLPTDFALSVSQLFYELIVWGVISNLRNV